MKEVIAGIFYLPFRWLYFFVSLRLRDKKKIPQNKKKNPFWFKIFLPIAGRREGEEGEKVREEKQRKSNTLNQANSNLPGESIARERDRVLFL